MGMKRVEIKSKIVSRGGMAEATASAKAASVDLSGYLPKETWEKVFKFVTDEAGNEHIFSNMPFALKYGLTMYADDGSLNLPDIFRGLPIDNVTLYWDNGVLKAMGGGAAGGGGVADSVLWANVIGKPVWLTDAKPTYAWGEISERPTKLSQFTDDVVSGKYLPLGGGTLSNTLQIGSANNTSFMALQLVRSGSGVRLNNTNANAYLSFNTVDSNSVFTAQNTLILGNDGFKYSPDGQKTLYEVWHSGNDGAGSGLDADTLDGYHASSASNTPWGTIPRITPNGNMDVGQHFEFHYDNTTGSDYSTLLGCTGNYSNIVNLPSKSGTLALTTDNVASATKLQTARTIWGQSFDGTGNIVAMNDVGMMSSNNYYGFSILPQSSGNYYGCRTFITYDGGQKMNAIEIAASYKNKGLSIGFANGLDYNYNTIPSSATYTDVVVINSSGNVGIGTTSPSCKLHVAGDILATGGITMYSMRALKDVVDERGLSLDELVQIKPTRYTWKDGRDDRLHIGGIADDVRKVLPEVVYETAEGVLTMDYGNAAFAVAASLIQPVMSHEERISMLEKENRELKIEVERLKKN